MRQINLMHDEIEELENYREFCLGMESERPAHIAIDNNPSHFTEQAEWAEGRLKELKATKPQQEVKERPIIFSADMVRKILAGEKTQTRRVIKQQPELHYRPELYTAYRINDFEWRWRYDDGHGCSGVAEGVRRFCPYGKVGDRLWVRETWAWPGEEFVLFKATEQHIQDEMRRDENNPQIVWKSPLFLPRWASRITLEIVGVKVERVQDISEEDARAEGMNFSERVGLWTSPEGNCLTAGLAYRYCWDYINGKKAGCDWQSNPWVWVLEFRRVD